MIKVDKEFESLIPFTRGRRINMYEKFEELLNARKVSAADVAKATGIYPSTFSDWKSGRSNPGVEKLAKIAKFFGVRIEDFLEDKETA